MYFEIFQGINGEWYWHLKSANHETIAASEGYVSKQSCLYCIGLVMDTTRDTPIYLR